MGYPIHIPFHGMISQIYHTVIYPAKIPNPYQKNGMVSDPTHTIPGYDMVLLGMEYSMKYIIPFRLVIVIIIITT